MENIFSTKGLTSSEANHVTNITKELVKDLQVDKLALSTAVVHKNEKVYPLDENTKVDFVDRVQTIGKLYSLSAWLKSAIKLKETKLRGIDFQSFETSVPSPEFKELPERPNTSFEAYLAQLNTKERAEYLSHEAVAAHVGAFVHNFDTVRESSESFVPTEFRKLAENQIVEVVKTRLYTHDELLKGFFTLQKQHREAEKVVNLYKSRHKSWEKESLDKYSNEHQKINSENTDLQLAFNREVMKEREAWEKERREKRQELSALKIIIPKDLQSTLDYVNEYAKE